MKRNFLILLSILVMLGLSKDAFAQKITILYTGQTHANLYPCHCPIEPFGGVARRATKIKELRKLNPNILLLDAGAFFAGGIMDETNQTPELQKQRTQAYLQTLKMMGYDALNVGSDEFNFGKDFLEAQINEAKIPFLSCNIKLKKAQEFIIKEISGVKIGIVGVGPSMENQDKKLQISDSVNCLQESVNKLKNKNVDLTIVLSSLGEEKDLELIKKVKGINILISGGTLINQDKFSKVEDAIILRPMWQARKLGMLEINLKDKKIDNFNIELLPLGADIPDELGIKAILPACFSDYDCLKPDFIGTCDKAGAKDASCSFKEIKKLTLLVIKPKNCLTCNTAAAINNIKRLLPIEVKYADYEEESSKKLIEGLNITMLPAYILTSEVEQDKNFSRFKDILIKKDNYYFFKPYFSGVSYLVGRPFKKNTLDLFMLLSDKRSAKAIETLSSLKEKMAKKINLNIHFLIIEDAAKGFLSPGGLSEIEEAKRSVCVEKYYPARMWDYLICRTKDIESSWWDKCLISFKIDDKKIKSCATTAEADDLLRQNLKLNQELRISDTPILLLNNQEVFGITEQTTAEELERIISASN